MKTPHVLAGAATAVVAVFSLFAPAFAAAATNTTLTVSPETTTYGGTVTLQATLTTNPGGKDVANQTVFFTLGGVPVGSAKTDANGLATLNGIQLTALTSATTHTNYIGGAFLGSLNPLYEGDTGSANLTVNKKTLTVSGITTNFTKPYDSTTAFTGTFNTTNAKLNGVLKFDQVNLVTTGATGVFASPNAGTEIVNISGLSLSGSSAGNYVLGNPQATTTATITKTNQTFSFNSLANQVFGNPDFTVTAIAQATSSNQFVGFGSCWTDGSTVHLLGIGGCTIDASNPGDQNYNPSSHIQQSFAVNAATDVVYDAIPATFPGNIASEGFESDSVSEMGDEISLAGTSRLLNTVTVMMSTWAEQSDKESTTFCTANPSDCSANGYTWPITINVYSTHLNANGVPDQLLATKTEDVQIPWKPLSDPTCPDTGYGAGFAWRNPVDGKCYNGFAFNTTFDLSDLDVILPSNVIVSVAYNTQDYGAAPTHAAGPYESLNVGVNDNQTVSVGNDDNSDAVFLNSSWSGAYGSSGTTGIFRQDTDWSPNGTLNLEITASPVTTSSNSVTVQSPDLAASIGDAVTNPTKWFFYNEETNAVDNTLGSFVQGPATAPLGKGSAQISVTADNQSVSLGTLAYEGTSLSKIQSLSYSTYRSAGDSALALALQFDINTNGTTTPASYEGRLVYEPYYTHTVSDNTWQTWNPMDNATSGSVGNWYFSKGTIASQSGCSIATPCTWSEILAKYPNIGISGGTYFKAGSGWDTFTGNVDDFAIGVQSGSNVNTATYDFEPSFGNLVINNYGCPVGTVVTRAANGVGGTIPAGCVPEAGTYFGYVHGSQTNNQAPFPELSEPFTLAGSSDNSGTLSLNLSSDGRYLVAETDASGNQLPASAPLGLYCTGDGDTSGTNDNQELTFVPANGSTNCVAYNPVIDTTAPVVTVSPMPTDGNLSGTVNFTITVTDNNPLDLSKLSKIYSYLYNSGGTQKSQGASVTFTATGNPDVAQGTLTVDTTKLDNGDAWLDVGQLFDAAGNASGPGDTYFKDYTINNAPVTTDAANPVNTVDATLNGTVGATNADNTSFWWGTTPITGTLVSGTDPGSTEFPASGWQHDSGLGNFAANANFSESVKPLSPNTTYYFVAWAQIGGIWYPGSVESFMTGNGSTPTVTTDDATGISTSTVTANATVGAINADNTSFWWGTTPIGTLTPGANPGASNEFPASGWNHDSGLGNISANGQFTESLPNLTPDTQYSFVAWIQSNGIWYPGNVETFMTSSDATVTTDLATNVTPYDAQLNGMVGPTGADQVSFWISTTPGIDTSSPNMPSGVISTPVTSNVSANTAFSDQLSIATTQGIPSNLPTIQPNTKYYYVAWALVNGTWYPGTEQTFTTGDGPAIGTPGVTTDAADNVSDADATMHATNGGTAADGESFWVSTSTIDFSNPNNIPNGVYSTPVLPGIATSSAFSDQLSLVTTNGITANGNENMMPITPDTTYNYVAWVHVNGQWYNGGQQSVETTDAPPVIPTANGDTATTDVSTPVTINVLANDAGNPTMIDTTSLTQPSHGSAVIDGTEIVYTPNANYSGNDSFTYEAANSAGTSSPATVDVTVTDTATPVLTVNGNNPDYISTNTTYSDAGVSISDVGSPNIGYTLSFDGEATTTETDFNTADLLSTTTPGTHTILYAATNNGGNTGYATRTVIVEGDETVNLTSTSATTGTINDNPIQVTATFSQPIQSFDTSNVTVANGVVGNIQIDAASTTVTFDVTPAANGTVTVTIPSGSVKDMADGSTSSDSSISFTYATSNSGNSGNSDGSGGSGGSGGGNGAPPTTYSKYDLNHDGKVNLLDLNILFENWGKQNATAAEGDFNGDGVINLLDLNQFLANWLG